MRISTRLASAVFLERFCPVLPVVVNSPRRSCRALRNAVHDEQRDRHCDLRAGGREERGGGPSKSRQSLCLRRAGVRSHLRYLGRCFCLRLHYLKVADSWLKAAQGQVTSMRSSRAHGVHACVYQVPS